MKATLIYKNKRILPDGSIEEMVIWKLPKATSHQPHGFKYRLNFGLADGTCLVRYDNERGKGDHKHLLDREQPYKFTTIEKLLEDFLQDEKSAREGNQ
ncbi:hypothetical protein KF913_26635 [Candidatus Obscuribacterales bacterium]|nr:hypothetical protein [Candidatus Obscuribacterales bacterium]